MGIPYYDAKIRNDETGIDIQVPQNLVQDLQIYLRDVVPAKSDLILSCYDHRIKEYQFSSKVNGLQERVLFGELNLARLNLESQDLAPVKIEKPKPQIKVEIVSAHGAKSDTPATADKNCKVICPSDVLEQFRELMSQTQVLGTEITDPYTDKTFTIPSNPQELQPWHLHLLARNEHKNVNGVFNFKLYSNLMKDDQITRLRCLVKATTLVGLDSVEASGGYPNGNLVKKINDPQKIIVIDQSGLQWQDDHRNTGGMFFYPDPTANTAIISGGDYMKFQEFQKDMYQAMYGIKRPENCDSDNIEVNWLGVKGKIDLKGVSLGIKEEFLQALNSAIASSDFLEGDEKIVFRFLKAGMGFFRSGILSPYSQLPKDKIKIARLENARLRGIMDALQELDNVLPKEPTIREKFFKKVKALQLPFSKNLTSLSSSDQFIEEEHTTELSILDGIKNLASKLGIEHKGDHVIDACEPESGFIVATTNTGDPHALLGNEGGYQSVDAAISSNLVNPKKFHFIEKNFSQPEKNITGHRFGQKIESQEVVVPQAEASPSALSPLTGLRKVLTPKLEFYGMELTSEKYNYRPIADEDADYQKFSKKIVDALHESFNQAIQKQTSHSPHVLSDDKKEELLIAIMQIADKNRGIGNCRPETIKEQIKKLMNESDKSVIDLYYKVAVNFSANFQRKAIAKTGNIDSKANHQVDLRLFRVCTWKNMQDVCLKFFKEKTNNSIEKGHSDKIILLTKIFQENSKKLTDDSPQRSPTNPTTNNLNPSKNPPAQV
ncbi:hypothetical protein LBMAG18_07950 [Alphaproteobacteria bacterium]|nr:hypothetical protein LBMAG18_07950 [Alphaproteobacteria bacterium]